MSNSWLIKVFFMSLLLCFAARGFSDYEDEEDPCPISPDDNSLRCRRYNSCIQCRYHVENCFCDTMCHNYDDCCPDVMKNYSSVYKPPRETVNCTSLIVHQQYAYASVISKCPNISTSEESKKCAYFEGPLVYGGKSRLIYKNTHCSRCHGEGTYEFVPFSLICKTSNYTHGDMKAEMFKIFTTGNGEVPCKAHYGSEITNKAVDYHPCIADLISSCPNGSDPQKVIGCETHPMDAVYYFNGYVSMRPTYRNEFCAQCHNISRLTCKPPARFGFPPAPRGFESLVDIQNLECIMKEDSLENVLKCGSVSDDTDSITEHLNNLDNETDRNASRSHIQEKTTPKGLLTVVLVVISLVSLLIQLLFYCYFKHLRNLPGLVVICLASSLFTALLCFLISLFIESFASYGTCIAVAVLQHWAFLCSFFWTNVMAFDVTRMLQLSTTHQGNKKKKFVMYSLYAWSGPTVLTVSALVADKFQWKIRPNYGSPRCWINSTFGLITYFLCPLFLIILVNIYMYVASIVSIVRSVRQTRMVNPDVKDRLILSIRLIIIMGLPWIFSVVTAFTESDVADYIFIVLNALQGFFILMTFVLNKTFVRMCKSEILKPRRSDINKTSSYALSGKKSEETPRLHRRDNTT